MNNKLVVGLCLGMTMAMISSVALADRAVRFERANPMGGTTAGMTRHLVGEQGGSLSQRRVIRGDGSGNGRVVTGTVVQGANGGTGARAGTTSRSADGSIQHQSGMSASGSRGSVQSSGSTEVDSTGNISQGRSTSATNATTGNSYQGSTTYSSASGVNHSGTCYDSAGNVIACPSR